MKIRNLTNKLTSYSTAIVVGIGTFVVMVSSVMLVYGFAKIFDAEYTFFLFLLSVVLPLVLTPITIYIMVKLSYKLKTIQQHLQNEIDKNHEKELLLFEQARYILMGEMMANISHQWKQPLNTINLAIVNMKLSQKCNPADEKYLDIIENNTNHLAATINDFLSFFDKRTNSDMKSLKAIKKEIVSIMGIQLENKNISLEIDIDSDQKISISSSIVQVILNLINNAKDAVDGQVQKKIKLAIISKKDSVEIYCCDSGMGISDDIKEKIFLPYFTTKSIQRGTGIGLYMSREIMEKIFHGELKLSQKKYQEDQRYNTCFYIRIPASELCFLQKEEI